MTIRQQLTIEAAGAVLLVAGLTIVHIALGLVMAGVMLVLAATFLPLKEEETHDNNSVG